MNLAHALLLLSLLVPLRPALACLWDEDTLKEESFGLAEVAETVQGKIFKHSPVFYERKVAYTESLLKQEKVSPDRYDDLAVAYEKLGRTQEAIALMEVKEKRFPGLYTTAANLGTFHAHAGDFPKALELLRKGLKINPNAHFGREKYQVKAIEYLQRLAKNPELVRKEELLGLPLAPEDAAFVMNEKERPAESNRPKVPNDAATALAGIIRFGSGDKSPHVWFSLGNALAWQGHKNLAIRALRRAELLGHPLAREHAEALIVLIDDYSDYPGWAKISAELDAEFAKGQAWVRAEQRKEETLIEQGKLQQVFNY
ncbi:MAG TPA: tetratricopeptide repeat protein [Myxococcaceae bacterium]|jgi:tetratricopeptide (TPR) repeat protein